MQRNLKDGIVLNFNFLETAKYINNILYDLFIIYKLSIINFIQGK